MNVRTLATAVSALSHESSASIVISAVAPSAVIMIVIVAASPSSSTPSSSTSSVVNKSLFRVSERANKTTIRTNINKDEHRLKTIPNETIRTNINKNGYQILIMTPKLKSCTNRLTCHVANGSPFLDEVPAHPSSEFALQFRDFVPSMTPLPVERKER